MDLQTVIGASGALWGVAPVRWLAYIVIALAVVYWLTFRVRRYMMRDGSISLVERIVLFPLKLALAILSWLNNWTLNVLIWWDSGPAWPRDAWETTTERLQRTLDRPELHPPRAVYLARRVEPWMNKQDPGHLE